jgi:hypothetical protein
VQIAIQGFAASTNINNAIVTLVPMKDANNLLLRVDVGRTTVWGWRCGSALDGTNVNPKYLPGSCRG